MTTVIDDRTDAQRDTHTVLIVGDDGFMTRWGHRCGVVGKTGKSRAAWACTPDTADAVERWARARNDLKRVRRSVRVYAKKGDHIHVYVVTDGHPALGGD